MILIVGASGTLGKVLVEELSAKGESVRALSRDPGKLARYIEKGVEVVKGDLTDKASLRAACAGADKVIACAHSLFGRGRLRSEKVDHLGHLDLIDAAKAAGVKHFVYISVIQSGKKLPVPFINYKKKVEQYLQRQELDNTIIRPSAFMEVHAHMLIGESILKKGKVTVFGSGDTKRNFVAVKDVAEVVIAALSDPELKNRAVDVIGPENHTTKEVIQLYEKALNKPAKVTHVPTFVVQTMSKALKPFHPGLSQVMAWGAYTDKHGDAYHTDQLIYKYPLKNTTLEDWIGKNI